MNNNNPGLTGIIDNKCIVKRLFNTLTCNGRFRPEGVTVRPEPSANEQLELAGLDNDQVQLLAQSETLF